MEAILAFILLLIFPSVAFAGGLDFISSWAEGQSWFQMAGEIMIFATSVTMAMPTRWYKNNGEERSWYKWLSKGLNFMAGNVFRNKNADDK